MPEAMYGVESYCFGFTVQVVVFGGNGGIQHDSFSLQDLSINASGPQNAT